MTDPRGARPDNSFDLVLFLWERRRLILGITLFGLVAGIAAAFIIRPLFKSEVILFPAVTNSVSKSLLSEMSTGRDDILALGDPEDAEQLLQVLNSDLIRERTATTFDLMRAYRIEADSRTRNTELQEAFKRHITFEYTKFGSVRVEVLHPEPDTAAMIANFIAAQVDSVWKDMVRERADKGLRIVAEKVRELEVEIAAIDDSMQVLRELGVHDYHSQTERFNEYLGAAIVEGDQRAVGEFEERFKVLARYGGAYVTLQDRHYNEMKLLSVLRLKLEQAQADRDSDLPHKFVVNRAQPADKKSYPVRWLVVMVSTISAFLLALLLIVVQENIRKIRMHDGRRA